MTDPIEPRRATLEPGWLGSLEPLPWSWVSERLERARNYWLVSARADGAPRARPVWGLWVEQLLFLSVGGGGLRRGPIGVQPVTVHLDDAANVVILEGLLERTSRDPENGTFDIEHVLPRLIQRWNEKYETGWTPERYGLNFVIRPSLVLAWREREDRTNADASGKWIFGASPLSDGPADA